MKMKKYISPCLLTVGVLTLAASVLLGYFVVPYKVKENVLQNSKIENGNGRFQKWEVVPVPLFQKIYLFNVTNGDEVMKGAKPILQELGPYVYQQKRRKFDITFNENDTIFYRERTDFYFRPDLSTGSESDVLTFVNLPFVIAALKGLSMGTSISYILAEALKKYSEPMYLSITVRELLFEGRFLPYVKELSEFRGEEVLPNNTFGLFYKRNGTDAGRFEIYSGVQDPTKFGNVVSWNGKTTMDWWEDENCNRINGSDGGVFPAYTTKDRVIYMFIPGLCKSLRFTFESDGDTVKGVPVLKYSLGSSYFQSARNNPDNACYCVDANEEYTNCPDDGVFFLSGCGKEGMVLSQPHFYQGSQSYINQSVGLEPNKDRHEMSLHLEPYTAAPARVRLRFQMNVEIKRNKFHKSLKKVTSMIHPLFWIDQSIELPDDAAAMMRDKLYRTMDVVNLVTQIGILIGCSFIILSTVLFCCYMKKSEPVNENKIEGVSYHAQGTLNVKLGLPDTNGKENHHNGIIQIEKPACVEEKNPLLNQRVLGDTMLSTNYDLLNSINRSLKDTEHSDVQVPSEALHKVNPPDSFLSPFPSSNDRSNSIADTHRDIIDAVSSYENLGD